MNSYGLTFAAGIVTAAALGDRLGRRRIYVVGLLLFTVASAACALAPTAAALIAARAVQGVGAAAVTPLSLTIATSAFPPARRGAVMLVAFVVREQRTTAPMLPLRLFRSVPAAAVDRDPDGHRSARRNAGRPDRYPLAAATPASSCR